MKTFTIKTNSWHYRLSALDGHHEDRDNICDYTRAVLGNLVLSLVGIALLGGFITCMVFIFMLIIKLIGILNLLLVVLSFASLSYLIGYFWSRRSNRAENSFIHKAYHSRKDKTCFKLDFTDHN